MKWYGFGHDFGNSCLSSAMCPTPGQTPYVRSVPTAFKEITSFGDLANLGINVDEIESIQLYGDSIGYVVGDFAQEYKDAWNGRGDISRYASKYSKLGLLRNAAAHIPDHDFGIYVVSGLPATTYIKKPELRERIKAALEGTHVFSIDQGKTWRTAHVKVLNVVMEGAG